MRGRPWRGGGEPARHHSAGPRRPIDARLAAAFLPVDWSSRTWLALDFETTGLSPRADRVVEIGALRFSLALAGPSPSGQASGPAAESRWEAVEHEALSVLVDPGIRIPPIVTGIHGIRDEDVAGKPAFSGYAARLLALAEGAIIIAHNAPFDLGFLREELLRAGLPACAAAAVDTRMLAKAAFPGLPSYSLGNLARGLGIETGNSHRALDDARACMRLFLASASRIAPARAAPLPPCGEGLP